jgi:hypothetical protein
MEHERIPLHKVPNQKPKEDKKLFNRWKRYLNVGFK